MTKSCCFNRDNPLPFLSLPSVVLPATLLVACETGKTELLQMLEVTAIGRHAGSQAPPPRCVRFIVHQLCKILCKNLQRTAEISSQVAGVIKVLYSPCITHSV